MISRQIYNRLSFNDYRESIMALALLQTASKRDQAAEALREAILGGEIIPGERIVESRIARQLGISQAPVREAMALLERQGLVVRIHNRGTFVSRLHGRELRELFTLRAVLDAFSARLAAERATETEIDRLHGMLAVMRDAEVGERHREADRSHLQLHEAIYRMSGHELLVQIFDQIHPRMALALIFAENLFSSEGHENGLPCSAGRGAGAP